MWNELQRGNSSARISACVCVLSTLGYVLAFGPALSETTVRREFVFKALQSLPHSFTVSFSDVLLNIY